MSEKPKTDKELKEIMKANYSVFSNPERFQKLMKEVQYEKQIEDLRRELRGTQSKDGKKIKALEKENEELQQQIDELKQQNNEKELKAAAKKIEKNKATKKPPTKKKEPTKKEDTEEKETTPIPTDKETKSDIDIVKQVIKDCTKTEHPEISAPYDEVLAMSKEKGLSKEQIEKACEYLMNEGDVYEPALGFMKMLEG
mgnify:CR=1 FL=1|jgi:TolA-binding protein|tara:strand:+ start:6104 stop:6697 length:594 start_codon:yes stop_codon:yes gene_type:complete